MGFICIGNKRLQVEREEVDGKMVAVTHTNRITRTIKRRNEKGVFEDIEETVVKKDVPKLTLIDKCKSHRDAIHRCAPEKSDGMTELRAAKEEKARIAAKEEKDREIAEKTAAEALAPEGSKRIEQNKARLHKR